MCVEGSAKELHGFMPRPCVMDGWMGGWMSLWLVCAGHCENAAECVCELSLSHSFSFSFSRLFLSHLLCLCMPDQVNAARICTDCTRMRAEPKSTLLFTQLLWTNVKSVCNESYPLCVYVLVHIFSVFIKTKTPTGV